MSAQLSAEEIRIVLVGKTGVGKSATGNTILGTDRFHKAPSSRSVTKECSLGTAVFNGKIIKVVDTPGWCDTDLSEAELTQATVKCIDQSYPGPHVFLFVLAIGRFTSKEKETIQQIQEIFGEGATRYTMILFTRGDDLENTTFEDYLRGASADLKALIDKCGRRCHVFNNRDRNRPQVTKLLQKIQDMVQINGGGYYTSSTYQLLEQYKKREAELQKKADDAQKEMEARNAELQRLIKHVEHEQQRQALRETQMQEQLMKQNHMLSTLLECMQIEEHQRMMEIERNKQKEEQLKHQCYMESEELKRKNRESEHRQRMEMEKQRFEKEKLEMSQRYEEAILELKEQNLVSNAIMQRLVKEKISKKNMCIIS